MRVIVLKIILLTEDEERVGSLLAGNLGTYSSIQSTILNSCNDYGKVTLEDGNGRNSYF